MVLVRTSYKLDHNHQLTKYCSESCIRGHRSSKCGHYDRPMKRVPKAGRPLANCVHIRGTDCDCREVWAIMVPLEGIVGLCPREIRVSEWFIGSTLCTIRIPSPDSSERCDGLSAFTKSGGSR
jgi:hypothetical protein